MFWSGFLRIWAFLCHHSFDTESLQQIEIKAQTYEHPFTFGFRYSSQAKLSDSKDVFDVVEHGLYTARSLASTLSSFLGFHVGSHSLPIVLRALRG